MCKQDFQIKRRVTSNLITGTASGLSFVHTFEYNENRFGYIVHTTTGGVVSLVEPGYVSAYVSVIENSSNNIGPVFLTFDQVGAYIWSEMYVRMTAAGDWSITELILPTTNNFLDNAIEVQK